MNKKETIEAASHGEGSLGKAADDEPVFVLRAQDICAPGTIEDWCNRVELMTKRATDKTQGARVHAAEMRDWQSRNQIKIPD